MELKEKGRQILGREGIGVKRERQTRESIKGKEMTSKKSRQEARIKVKKWKEMRLQKEEREEEKVWELQKGREGPKGD